MPSTDWPIEPHKRWELQPLMLSPKCQHLSKLGSYWRNPNEYSSSREQGYLLPVEFELSGERVATGPVIKTKTTQRKS